MFRARLLILCISLVLSTLLTSCGFQPLYKKDAANSAALSQIEVAPIAKHSFDSGRIDQLLQTELEDALHSGEGRIKNYLLEVRLNEQEAPLVIELDRSISRYNLHYIATYTLRHKADGRVLLNETTRLAGSYDALESDFATYTAREKTRQLVMKELARKIALKLATTLKNNS